MIVIVVVPEIETMHAQECLNSVYSEAARSDVCAWVLAMMQDDRISRGVRTDPLREAWCGSPSIRPIALVAGTARNEQYDGADLRTDHTQRT